MKKNMQTSDFVILAFLIALEIILTRFCSINTPILRIGFGFLPVAFAGIMFGPIWAGVGYAIGDILGMMIFPTGAYFPGFTLTALMTGIIFGLFLYNREITFLRVLPASLTVIILCNLILDTVWLSILMGQGYLALLPTRLIKCAVMLPVQVILIPLLWNKLMCKIPFIGAQRAKV